MERTDIIPPVTVLDKASSIEDYRIDPTSHIDEPPVYCRIGKAPAMTAGNFSLLNGKQKSGKTFLTGSIVASLISSSTQLEAINGCLPEGKNVILYFDTEQSPFHATRTVNRICKMAGMPDPDNLLAYGLRPLTPAERLQIIEEKISTTANLGAVVIDGIRDLLTIGINDEAEATSLTSKFLRWTADFNIHMILLLHQNKTDLNVRGHVGTELLNKSETTLTVTKDPKTNIFVVSCDYSRDLGFEDFGFTIEDGLPKATAIPEEGQAKGRTPQSMQRDEHFEKLNLIFSKQRKLNGSELHEAIQYHFSVGVIRSRDFVYHYLYEGWIEKEREGKNVNYVYKRAIF